MGIQIECHNCGYSWVYGGSKPRGAHTNCPKPKCRYKVEIPAVEDEPRDS